MKPIAAATYAELRKKVQETLIRGQQKIEEARVQTYWETGHFINQHIQGSGERAEYGKKVILKLSKDLKVGDDLLYRCSRFAAQFPISASWRKLSWSHLRALGRVSDDRKRLELSEQAFRNEWSSDVLEVKVRNLLWDRRVEKAEGKPPSLLFAPKLGTFFTYRILAVPDEWSKTRRTVVGAKATTDPKTVQPKEEGLLLLDLGFASYRDLDAVTSKTFKPFGMVTSTKTGDDTYALKPFLTPNSQLNPQDLLYTYNATIEKIVDGDTLRVVVDLGFNTRTRQYIRLKGIDCPEMDTDEGKSAKRFVENALQGLEAITLKTIRSDKYDRYLGDVFFPGKDGQEVYLNNLLLEKGHAVKVRA